MLTKTTSVVLKSFMKIRGTHTQKQKMQHLQILGFFTTQWKLHNAWSALFSIFLIFFPTGQHVDAVSVKIGGKKKHLNTEVFEWEMIQEVIQNYFQLKSVAAAAPPDPPKKKNHQLNKQTKKKHQKPSHCLMIIIPNFCLIVSTCIKCAKARHTGCSRGIHLYAPQTSLALFFPSAVLTQPNLFVILCPLSWRNWSGLTISPFLPGAFIRTFFKVEHS